MNKTRCEIALDISLRAVQHDLDGDSALACKLYKDASRALEDAIAHARNGAMEENDIEQMQRKVKEYRERAETLSSRSKGGGGGEDDDREKTNVVAGAAAAGAVVVSPIEMRTRHMRIH